MRILPLNRPGRVVSFLQWAIYSVRFSRSSRTSHPTARTATHPTPGRSCVRLSSTIRTRHKSHSKSPSVPALKTKVTSSTPATISSCPRTTPHPMEARLSHISSSSVQRRCRMLHRCMSSRWTLGTYSRGSGLRSLIHALWISSPMHHPPKTRPSRIEHSTQCSLRPRSRNPSSTISSRLPMSRVISRHTKTDRPPSALPRHLPSWRVSPQDSRRLSQT